MTDDEWARHRDLTVLHQEFLYARMDLVVRREHLLRELRGVTALIDEVDRVELLRLHELRRDLEGDEEIYPVGIQGEA